MTSTTIRSFAIAAALCAISSSMASAQQSPASTGAGATIQATAPAAPTGTRRARDLITAEEVGNATDSDAYTLIARLRSSWTRVRGAASFNRPEQVMVHINGSPAGGLAALRQVKPSEIIEVRHLDGNQATQRFGTGYGGGVIMVTTR